MGKHEFDSIKEILVVIDEKNKTEKPKQFCPIINDICRKDCVCFVKYYQLQMSGKYYIHGFYCNNPMLKRNFNKL